MTDSAWQHHVLRLDGSQHRTVGDRQPWQHHVLRLDGSQHRTVSTTNGNTTTVYDNFGRRTGSIQGSR